MPWLYRSGSTLAQVMACCLMAPSHYLIQCWLIISQVVWHSPDGNIHWKCWQIIHLKSQPHFPGGNELMQLLVNHLSCIYMPQNSTAVSLCYCSQNISVVAYVQVQLIICVTKAIYDSKFAIWAHQTFVKLAHVLCYQIVDDIKKIMSQILAPSLLRLKGKVGL